uniref:Malate dehydrogenase, cytoplasmic n=1 Tax=Tegula funebralis TaxID=80350 RepID=A0A2K9YNB8_TEGFU|nr:cytosolic malate dehydrogenase [Tegula funebralis]
MSDPLKVLVTGAAGQIAYSLVISIAKGDVFGADQPVHLVLLDIPPMKAVLDGVVMELMDCALPLLTEITPLVEEAPAFKDIDVACLVGAMPRKEGMERKDLLAANVKIFKSQGNSLEKYAKKTVKVVVVGNPANTNAFIAKKYAPSIPAANFSCLTRLDQNRGQAQIASRLGVPNKNVSNVIIWGNHSSTQFPDVSQAKVVTSTGVKSVRDAVGDDDWLNNAFITTVQKRGAAVIAARKLSSAMSAAKATCDHLRDWFMGTKEGTFTSMGIVSDGSYGIPAGLVYSFPVTIAKDGSYKIVQDIAISDFARQKMDATKKELEEERDMACSVCEG